MIQWEKQTHCVRLGSRWWRGLRWTSSGRWSSCTMRWSARDPELSVVDAYTRECLALEVDTRSPSLGHGSQLYSRHFPAGPQAICCDNGPNLTSRDFFGVVERQIELVHVQLGKPAMEPNKFVVFFT